MDIAMYDPKKARSAALRAFKNGLAFRTVCEWCGWSGSTTELNGTGDDGVCPLCWGRCEWKKWPDMQNKRL